MPVSLSEKAASSKVLDKRINKDDPEGIIYVTRKEMERVAEVNTPESHASSTQVVLNASPEFRMGNTSFSSYTPPWVRARGWWQHLVPVWRRVAS